MTEILQEKPHLSPVEIEAELDALARRYQMASGLGINLLNLIGGQVENLLVKLPAAPRAQLGQATEQALHLAMQAACQSRRLVPGQSRRVNRLVSTAMGAAGGAGGLPGALVELPATTAFLLRTIQDAAAAEGFDPNAESVMFDCLRVFASAGPLARDDGSDTAFVSLRVSLSGQALNQVITTVAPRLATAFGHKLAAQSVPILGAAAGATVNYVYSGYYHEVALVHFGLRRLAIEADQPEAELLADFVTRLPLRP
ncbi:MULTISPECIES: EcsC family protein [unclassified Pseudophaeobacter]|uniref:EcsC family protein n=1 Tax=unclassified Pseudophaeobacter TaxID=2637024 RepID=UPI000EFAA422|nr:EcsC family protein [Pseudophaeobacter sp. EL27]